MTSPSIRLVVLFDGTWNDPQDLTNVCQLARHIADRDPAGVRQRFFYHPGVGTKPHERFRGGAFGYGLSRNLQEGYDWLARHHEDGAEIHVYGFSRGAYTARSLVGMIRKCGLVHISTPHLLDRAEALYRDKTRGPDHPDCVRFRRLYGHSPEIHCLGVWDTVGALGVPGTIFSSRGLYSWHDTSLSKIVRHAYHAMALDERREAYDAVLWTGNPKPEHLDVEQRWFVGAHADIGGGYPVPADAEVDPLPSIPYAWMRGKIQATGLHLNPFASPPHAWKAPPHDSYGEFLGGVYAGFRRIAGRGPFTRRFDKDEAGIPATNVSVDDSVWEKWTSDPSYRPAVLLQAGIRLPS